MKTKTENLGRFLALFLAMGLLVALVVLISTPSLLAQDGTKPVPDGGREIYVIDSIEDIEALPLYAKQRMQKGISFGAAGSFEFGQSTKVANRNNVLAGEQVTFTILAWNSGDVDSPPMSIEDTLPVGLTYVSHEFKTPNGGLQTGGGENNGVVTWEGSIVANGTVEIVIVAEVDAQAQAGTEYMNTAVITAGDKTTEPSMTITVVDENSMPLVHLPMVIYGKKPLTPDIISIESTRPNSQNTWTVSWNGAGAVSYELQESKSPGFANAVSLDIGPEASKSFAHEPSPFNVHYYRVRSKAGGVFGNWSETLKVVGGYWDDFNDPNTGWSHDKNNTDGSGMRRISHLDEVRAWYEFIPNDIKWHILQVGDRFDMGLVSPMMEAPSIPYAIQLELKSPDPANMNGMGFVFAGDKKTDECPQVRDTTEGWYEHKDCFNQFYEVMLIENPAGEKRDLIVQRVVEVEWIGPGGSIPVHRVVGKQWKDLDISSISWGDWDAMRAEVFANRIEIYAGKRGGELRHRLTLNENMYPSNPFFGTIATTQERPTATARYEFFKVLPLDS